MDGLGYLSESVKKYLTELLEKCTDQLNANTQIEHLTGIEAFFPTQQSLNVTRLALEESANVTGADEKSREYGDYQTPMDLTEEICRKVKRDGLEPTVLIEPTFGRGNFIIAGLRAFPSLRQVYGVEVQEHYVWETKFRLLEEIFSGRLKRVEIRLIHADFFTYPIHELKLESSDEILILGNPPWVTNAELGELNSTNLPEKINFKNHIGINAITGASNFDIAEPMIMQLLKHFSTSRGQFVMICKNAVIKNILYDMRELNIPLTNLRSYEINSRKIFQARVSASIFIVELGGSSKAELFCQSLKWEDPTKDGARNIFGWCDDKFVGTIDDYESVRELDGVCPFVWRQGLKHDCSKVMELRQISSKLYLNGLQEQVELDEDTVYGLLKSSDLQTPVNPTPRRRVIVPQKSVGEETDSLEHKQPLTWKYLIQHAAHLERRKSAIYKNQPRFAIFGIGEYSFAPYKVGISGLYKEANFSLIFPYADKPVMLDDTCYFLGFDRKKDAMITWALLNSDVVKRFIKNVAFLDAKRPYTKNLLMRINLQRVHELISFQEIKKLISMESNAVFEEITIEDYRRYGELLSAKINQSTL